MNSIKDHLGEITGNDYIDGELYGKYNVKRGLRNTDGTGVLVGLTRIGDVHGYIVDEGEKVAIPGKLFYRGIDVEDIVAEASRTIVFVLRKRCTFCFSDGCRTKSSLRILTP